MTLLYDSGARVQELIDLTVRDIRTENPATITLHGKGRKIRAIPLMDKTNNMMILYLKEVLLWQKPEMADHSVFYNNRKERLTRAGVTYIIQKHVDNARKNTDLVYPQKITPHVFRHTKAMHMLQANINLVYIRDFLGHVNVTTTEIYAKADSEVKRKVLESAYTEISSANFPEWSEDKSLMAWPQNLCQ